MGDAVESAFRVSLIILIFMLTLGLGATLDIPMLKRTLKWPRSRNLLVGMFCQFAIMPLVGYLMALAFGFPAPIAIGLIMTATSPGGSTSNLFTYFSKGDVALSICMTAVSTAAASVFMPLWLLVYATPFLDKEDNTQIPYGQIVLVLLLVLIPAAIGLYTRHKSERIAKHMERGATAAGILFIAGALVVGIISNVAIFAKPFPVFVAAFLLEVVGALFGYSIARGLKTGRRQARTVAFETGIQNSTLTLAVVDLSFGSDPEFRNEVAVFPLIYSLFLVINSVWISLFFRYYWAKDEPQFEKLDEEGDEAETEAAERVTSEAIPIDF